MNDGPTRAVTSPGAARPLSPGRRAWREFRRHPAALGSALFLAAIIALILLWPVGRISTVAAHLPAAMTWSPNALSEAQFAPPSWGHWLGTDVHGRDLLSRLMAGTRISCLVGLVGAVMSLGIGVVWGAVAGYLGGRWDSMLMRIVDILYTLPSIVFVMVLMAVAEAPLKAYLGRTVSTAAGDWASLLLLFGGLGAVSWLTMARIVRGQVLTLRTRGFVEASRGLGAGHLWILRRHLLPNLAGIVIVYLALTVPSVVLYESFLSFLGLGVQPPQASLGYLIADGAGNINAIRTYWWLVVFPGGTLVALLLALNFVGDGLRDAWDPRSAIQ
jgi:peptide/nickel transport system permease protein/oligopeptide transport system permease protein